MTPDRPALMSSSAAANNPLFARFAGVPALLAPEMRDHFEGCLAALARHDKFGEMLAERASEDGFWPEPDSWKAAYRPYVVVAGVLQIPVKGILLNDFSFAVGNFATGYVYIRRALERGVADPNVRGIAFIHNSPGGEVAGNFDLVDRIFATRGTKPMRAFVAEHSYSASYSLATAADRIVMPRTGGVGSIGVVSMHFDFSKFFEQAGIAVTLVEAPKGGFKTDGYPYKPLSASAEAGMQERVDALYDIFVASVARNRDLKESAVRDTKGRTFMAPQAVSMGLADAVGVIADEVAAFAADLSAAEGNEDMSKDNANTNGAVTTTAAATLTQADVDTARAQGETAGKETGKAEGMKEGTTAERSRCQAIMTHANAEGRSEMAQYLAFETDMPSEKAIAMLGKSPKGTAAGSLGSQMSQEQQPNLGHDANAKKPANEFEAGRAAVLATKPSK